MSERYRLRIARPAAKALSEALSEALPEKVAVAASAFITGPLLDNSHQVGKPFNPPLAPAWTARRGSYRILYHPDENLRIVEVTAIRHRSDAYRT
jgi:mRNA-degrading endonuclease RelE of RelBE toxin-antitoxin system